MDQQKDDEQTDYWLIQYQRLLDSKPQAVIDRVGFTQCLQAVIVRICSYTLSAGFYRQGMLTHCLQAVIDRVC